MENDKYFGLRKDKYKELLRCEDFSKSCVPNLKEGLYYVINGEDIKEKVQGFGRLTGAGLGLVGGGIGCLLLDTEVIGESIRNTGNPNYIGLYAATVFFHIPTALVGGGLVGERIGGPIGEGIATKTYEGIEKLVNKFRK